MHFSSSNRPLVIAAVAFVLTLLALGKSALAQEVPFEPLREATITITGTGSLDAQPDIAIVRAGAVTEARTAREAMDANAAIMAQAFASLSDLGVADTDRQTSQLTVEPRYTYFDSSNGERRPPRIDGYRVSNQLTVRVRDLPSIGDILDALITAGVNQMGGLSFGIDDPQALYQQARRDAVADAIAQAELLTEAAGVSLGRIVSISPAQPRQQPPQPVMARMALDSAAAESVPIATGEQELSAQVTITWALETAGQ